MTRANGHEDELYLREVRGKARRMSRARRREGGFWRHLAHVGSLGFVFVLPLLAGAAVGRLVAARTEHPGFAIAFLLVGLVAGGFASWRLIAQSIEEEDE